MFVAGVRRGTVCELRVAGVLCGARMPWDKRENILAEAKSGTNTPQEARVVKAKGNSALFIFSRKFKGFDLKAA